MAQPLALRAPRHTPLTHRLLRFDGRGRHGCFTDTAHTARNGQHRRGAHTRFAPTTTRPRARRGPKPTVHTRVVQIELAAIHIPCQQRTACPEHHIRACRVDSLKVRATKSAPELLEIPSTGQQMHTPLRERARRRELIKTLAPLRRRCRTRTQRPTVAKNTLRPSTDIFRGLAVVLKSAPLPSLPSFS